MRIATVVPSPRVWRTATICSLFLLLCASMPGCVTEDDFQVLQDDLLSANRAYAETQAENSKLLAQHEELRGTNSRWSEQLSAQCIDIEVLSEEVEDWKQSAGSWSESYYELEGDLKSTRFDCEVAQWSLERALSGDLSPEPSKLPYVLLGSVSALSAAALAQALLGLL